MVPIVALLFQAFCWAFDGAYFFGIVSHVDAIGVDRKEMGRMDKHKK